MSARKTATRIGSTRPRQVSASKKGREEFERRKKQLKLIQEKNERRVQETIKKIKENNEKIRRLLERAFTSKRERGDVSPAVRQQLEKLEKVLSKHEDRNQQVLKQIALALDDAVLLTTEDIKAAQDSERDDTFFRRLTKSITRRVTKRRSPTATRGGRKTRKQRSQRKQKTHCKKQKRKGGSKTRKLSKVKKAEKENMKTFCGKKGGKPGSANKKKCNKHKDKCKFVDMGSGGEWCLPLKK